MSAMSARLQQPVNESCTARRKSSFCGAVKSLDHCNAGQGRREKLLVVFALPEESKENKLSA